MCITTVNNVGIGLYSDSLAVLTDGVPTSMYTPSEEAQTNKDQISVKWQPITDDSMTGRDPILYYRLEWD